MSSMKLFELLIDVLINEASANNEYDNRERLAAARKRLIEKYKKDIELSKSKKAL